jgi:hypothetical protein
MLHDKEELLSKTAELFEIKKKMSKQTIHFTFVIISTR